MNRVTLAMAAMILPVLSGSEASAQNIDLTGPALVDTIFEREINFTNSWGQAFLTSSVALSLDQFTFDLYQTGAAGIT